MELGELVAFGLLDVDGDEDIGRVMLSAESLTTRVREKLSSVALPSMIWTL